jgi:hypothetical protein
MAVLGALFLVNQCSAVRILLAQNTFLSARLTVPAGCQWPVRNTDAEESMKKGLFFHCPQGWQRTASFYSLNLSPNTRLAWAIATRSNVTFDSGLPPGL